MLNISEKPLFFKKIYHQRILRPRIQKALKLASGIVSVSHSTNQSFKNTFSSFNSHVILNGIDTTLFKPLKSITKDSNHILLVGTLSKPKGR